MHRTLKTSLIAKASQWLEQLPIVLLGLRCPLNENGEAPFTAVKGQTLLIPHTMAAPSSLSSNVHFVHKLDTVIRLIDFASLSQRVIHGRSKTDLPPGLNSASHVWIRVDRIRRPLEAPYAGPIKVNSFGNKMCTVVTETRSEASSCGSETNSKILTEI